VLGHFHVDHAGNVGKFPDSTFVYQRDEIKNAFWPAPGYATFFIVGLTPTNRMLTHFGRS
jgi:N-acyl homoserine lactone hydrolase